MRSIMAAAIALSLLTGCVRAGMGPAGVAQARYANIAVTEDLSADTLSRLTAERESQDPSKAAVRLRLEAAMLWIPLIYMHAGVTGYGKSPEGQDWSPDGLFLTVSQRSAGPIGLLYLRAARGAFDVKTGTNRDYHRVRVWLWGILWADQQTKRTLSSGSESVNRKTGILWTAFGCGRNNEQRTIRFLFIPIPAGKAQ